MIKLLILADDFTGTLDTAVQFAEKGISVRISVDPEEAQFDSDYEVLAVDLETRHLDKREAYTRVYKIAKRGLAAGVEYIYKKTDSTLRGNIGSELEALTVACNQEDVCFLPAYPQAGRTTKKGVQYLDGVPIHKSIFGADPYEPVRYSLVSEIIGETSEIRTRNVGKDELESLYKGKKDCGEVMIVDAETVEDIGLVAEFLSRKRKLKLFAGCAGFATYLDRIISFKHTELINFPGANKLVMVSGSLNEVTAQQIRICEENSGEMLGRFTLKVLQKLQEHYFQSGECKETLRIIKEKIQNNEVCIIDTFDTEPGETKRIAIEQGLEGMALGKRIADNIGELIEIMTKSFPEALYLLTGGDTLYGYIKRHKKAQIIPIREVEKGAVLTAVKEEGSLLFMITKAGGLGTERVVENVKSYMKARTN
ncbi:uncharacterized protein YgbK (DUF1537 family) [Lachnospiraceae bacterium PF1-21]|uniref:four-carbon acid sugar kinase family protein n=1 Tax=Ohessyouella blattaphilus TaxID=2949333 RepID=UPI003E314ECC